MWSVTESVSEPMNSMYTYISQYRLVTRLNMDDSLTAMVFNSCKYGVDMVHHSVSTGKAIKKEDIRNITEAAALLSELLNNAGDKDLANMLAISFFMRMILLQDKNVDWTIDSIDFIEKMEFLRYVADKW